MTVPDRLTRGTAAANNCRLDLLCLPEKRPKKKQDKITKEKKGHAKAKMVLILRVPVLKFYNIIPTLSLRPAREVQLQLQVELRASPSSALRSNLTSHLRYLHLSLKSAGFLVFVHSRAVFAQVCNGDRLVTATCSNTGRKEKKIG